MSQMASRGRSRSGGKPAKLPARQPVATVLAKAGQPPITWSASAQMLANSFGDVNLAFFPLRSASVTARASEQPFQTWRAMPEWTALVNSSRRDGQPTGWTASKTGSFIR